MANIHHFTDAIEMRATEIVDTLFEAGFTKDQALALTSVITAIRVGRISHAEAETFLERNGFSGLAAQQISDVFFKALQAA